MIKFNKTLFILIIVYLMSVFISGCADSKDINKKSILTSVALDKKGDEIYLYVEIANIEGSQNEGNGGGGTKYYYIKSHGKTISEARDNLDWQLDKETYTSGVRAIVLTENFAKEHLVEYLYRVRADELYRKRTITVITKEDPGELFKINNDKDLSVGFTVEELLMSIEEAGGGYTRTTSRLLENLSATYTGILIPCIGLQNNDNSLIGYSVVRGTTIVGFMPVRESKGAVIMQADKARFVYVVPYKDNRFTIETRLKKREVKPSYKNGQISFDMNFSFEAELMYGNKKTPYNFGDVSNAEVTEILTEMLKDDISNAVRMAQKEFNSDYLQFDDDFRVKFPSEFEKMDWENEFFKADTNIEVKVELSSKWMMDYETGVRK